MKREHLGWIVAALLVVVVAAGAMQQQGQVGRYQLFQGRYDITAGEPGDDRREDAEALFRIDTQTGEVCRFVCAIGPAGIVEAWKPSAK